MTNLDLEPKTEGELVEILLKDVENLRNALKLVRGIIIEGSLTGFNCFQGTWAKRLYASQWDTSKALKDTE